MAVGRLVVQKDFPNLLRAFAQLADKKSILLIAGNGVLREELGACAAELGIADRVRFAGVRPDISGWYNAADAYVMSSIFEGLSVALLEAAASGLPFVVTDVGGNREIVLHGVNGYLVPSQDSAALGAAMQRLVNLPEEKLEEFRLASRNHCMEKYSMREIIREWEGIYDRRRLFPGEEIGYMRHLSSNPEIEQPGMAQPGARGSGNDFLNPKRRLRARKVKVLYVITARGARGGAASPYSGDLFAVLNGGRSRVGGRGYR